MLYLHTQKKHYHSCCHGGVPQRVLISIIVIGGWQKAKWLLGHGGCQCVGPQLSADACFPPQERTTLIQFMFFEHQMMKDRCLYVLDISCEACE